MGLPAHRTGRLIQTRLLSVRMEADLLASELGKGKSLDRIKAEQGWGATKLANRLAILSARNRSHLAPEDGEDVFHRYVDRTQQGMNGTALIKNDYTEGQAKTVIETHTEQVSPTETRVTRTETAAHGGVSASDFLAANRDEVRMAKEVIVLGQSLGVYPQAVPQEPPRSEIHVTQILTAIRTGDFATIERMAEGQDVAEKEERVVIDVPNLAEPDPVVKPDETS